MHVTHLRPLPWSEGPNVITLSLHRASNRSCCVSTSRHSGRNPATRCPSNRTLTSEKIQLREHRLDDVRGGLRISRLVSNRVHASLDQTARSFAEAVAAMTLGGILFRGGK